MAPGAIWNIPLKEVMGYKRLRGIDAPRSRFRLRLATRMPARFEFATANRILFGPGVAREAAPAAAQWGKRALVVTGRSPGRASGLLDDLRAAGVASTVFSVESEPTVDLVGRGVTVAREESCDLVIAMGGGSAIDAGKAIAALLTNAADVLEYLEVIGRARPLTLPPAPFIAVPTTAGTGSEVTRNAVLGSPQHRLKASLRSPRMLPRLAVVDPELTLSLPPFVTASTGMDALTQVIEPFVSIRANPMTDLVCVEGMRLAARSLRRAVQEPDNRDARSDMSLASLMGGLALANAGLGVVHGFAAPVGGMYDAPHGAICAAVLAPGVEANIRALRGRASDHPALSRYEAIAQTLTGCDDARPEDAVEWLQKLAQDLGIPSLRTYGVSDADLAAIVEAAQRTSSMKGNPIELTREELFRVLEGASQG